jgi:hypothetical protein
MGWFFHSKNWPWGWLIVQPNVALLIVPRVADVKIRSFWMKKMNGGTIFVFFYSTYTTYKKMKIQETKNKIYKPKEANWY